jgi:hypothetical protein
LIRGQVRIASCAASSIEDRPGTHENLVRIPLQESSVAEFYGQLTEALRSVGAEVSIWPHPVEVVESIPFDQDTTAIKYDLEFSGRFHVALLQADPALKGLQNGFLGKASPVHFFWGAFDLAYTRFSGRPAPPHPGGYPNVGVSVMREAYSHECASAGFWPGGGGLDEAAFYAYSYPEPEGFKDWPLPAPAYYHPDLREFVLPYEETRRAHDPGALLRELFESAFQAARQLGRWDAGLFRDS